MNWDLYVLYFVCQVNSHRFSDFIHVLGFVTINEVDYSCIDVDVHGMVLGKY